MPPSLSGPVDPVLAEITKAIYGDVDVREFEAIAKFSPGSSDVHVDGSMTPEQAKKQKKVAQVGLGATGVATVGGLHALSATYDEHLHRMEAAGDEKAGAKLAARRAKSDAGAARRVARVAGMKGPAGKVLRSVAANPRRAALAAGTGWAGLHGVELVGDGLGMHAQTKAIQQANAAGANKPGKVAKAFRLKPLNVIVDKTPSLRAKRPKLTPSPGNPTTKAGLYQPVRKGLRSGIKSARKTVREVKDTATHAEEVTRKLKALIPSPRTAALAVGGSVLGLGAAAGAGSYAGSYAGTRAGAGQAQKRKLVPVAPVAVLPVKKPVAKSEPIDVSWDGVITKVDADKRQVFGWASVSAINGEEVVDLQGDVVPIEETEKAAYRYVIDSRKGGDMHRRVSKSGYQLDTDQPLHTADMIESFVVTPEKLEKMGLPANSLPHGWWVGYHVNDDAQWNMVKSGERKGFSIHGKGSRTPISKADRPRLKERADQAIHPPKVTLKRVKSTAVEAMGYQRQTRRLSVAMRSRPDEPYEYKMKPGAASDALHAPSKGHYFATEVRGKAKRAKGYSVADRARLFIDPQEKVTT